MRCGDLRSVFVDLPFLSSQVIGRTPLPLDLRTAHRDLSHNVDFESPELVGWMIHPQYTKTETLGESSDDYPADQRSGQSIHLSSEM